MDTKIAFMLNPALVSYPWNVSFFLIEVIGIVDLNCACIRLRAKKGPAPPPPLGNFADISYLEENFKPHLLRDVCTLCSGALVSDSLLHMLL